MKNLLNLHSISISKILILFSFFWTLAVYFYPEITIFWLNKQFLNEWNYLFFLLQILIYNFLHWGIMHFLFNAIFIYYFWSVLELLIWKKKFIIFFIFTAIFNAIFINLFEIWNTTTIGISGFAMAIISYYTLELKSKNNPEWKGWVTAIILNIWIWFMPNISLYWHLFWAIAWIIFYFLNKEYFKRKMVGV